jgi:transcriptional regulator with XRE-family HTH domain
MKLFRLGGFSEMGRSRRPQPANLASKLREIRIKLSLSQQQMAEKLGGNKARIRPGHISDYELAKRQPPLEVLLVYSRLAGIYMDSLVDDSITLPEKLPASMKYKWALPRDRYPGRP